MAGVKDEESLNELPLQQELSGAKRLAEFRLQKVIELQDEVARLRRLLLTMRGGSEVLQRANSALPRSKPSATIARHMGERPCVQNGGADRERCGELSFSPQPKAPKGTQGIWREEETKPKTITRKAQAAVLRRPPVSLSPRPASGVGRKGKGSFSSTPKRQVSLSSLPDDCSIRSSSDLDAVRCVPTVPHTGASHLLSPFLAPNTSQSLVTVRPLIKLQTGVKLRGPKTFRRLPPPPLESLQVDEAGTSSGCGKAPQILSPQQRNVCSVAVIRREHSAVREALGMLRGIVLRADRNMLSTLTILSNSRCIDHALPTSLAEFKQILLRSHPSLTGMLRDGEAWHIDEGHRDALEVVKVPGIAAALRDLVITYDYTACVHQHLLHQTEGTVCAQLGKAFHEFYANIYLLLVLAQYPGTFH